MKINLQIPISKIMIVFQSSLRNSVFICLLPFMLFAKHNSDIDTIAIIGSKIISAKTFTESFKDKILKYGLTDNGEIRKKYLIDLVNDELLIAHAKQMGLNKTEEAVKELKRIRLQEALNAYTLKHISPAINITENDFKDLYIKLNTRIKVRHLYASTKEKADLLYSELQNGKSFKELAQNNFDDPSLKNNGGLLGYITIGETDPNFEETAYSMKAGEISKPVKTVEGYSIIKVDDIKVNPLLTETEFLKARSRIKAFVRKRAFEKAAKDFSHSLSEKLEIKFNNTLIKKIYALMNKSFINFIESPSLLSKKDLTKTVVSYVDGVWTLQTLINEMSIVTPEQRKWIKSEENLKDFISGLVNRKYIYQAALKEKLNLESSFKESVQFKFDTYLLTILENQLKEKIDISPDSVEAYYLNHKKDFRTQPEIRLSSILIDKPALADTINSMLKKGSKFEDLSRKFSIQKITAKSGGNMGFFIKKDLGEFADEIFSLKNGAWDGPFIYDSKYLFVKCTGYKKSKQKSLNECSKDIQKILKVFKWNDLRDKYIQSVKQDINCKLFLQKLYNLKL